MRASRFSLPSTFFDTLDGSDQPVTLVYFLLLCVRSLDSAFYVLMRWRMFVLDVGVKAHSTVVLQRGRSRAGYLAFGIMVGFGQRITTVYIHSGRSSGGCSLRL